MITKEDIKVGFEFFAVYLGEYRFGCIKKLKILDKVNDRYLIGYTYEPEKDSTEMVGSFDESIDYVESEILMSPSITNSKARYTDNIKDAYELALPILKKTLEEVEVKEKQATAGYKKYRNKLIECAKKDDDKGIDICLNQCLSYKQQIEDKNFIIQAKYVRKDIETARKLQLIE